MDPNHELFGSNRYYCPLCMAFDLYQTATCAIYTAKMTLGITTPMIKQSENYRLRSEVPMNGEGSFIQCPYNGFKFSIH